ncbi:MAG: hypothetical protein GYB31_01675 [Bacteroidetes bacterium]|nr:hypothetical protein [Bacteroidota bacterium]
MEKFRQVKYCFAQEIGRKGIGKSDFHLANGRNTVLWGLAVGEIKNPGSAVAEPGFS